MPQTHTVPGFRLGRDLPRGSIYAGTLPPPLGFYKDFFYFEEFVHEFL